MEIVSVCPFCGTIFKSRKFNFPGAITGLTLRDNKERCPKPGCGGMASVMDLFTSGDGGVTISFDESTAIDSALLEAVARHVLDSILAGEQPDSRLDSEEQRQLLKSFVMRLEEKRQSYEVWAGKNQQTNDLLVKLMQAALIALGLYGGD